MPRKILLADDSITIQKVIELTFSDEDFDVVTVGNGRLAIEKVQETHPDVVLCDIIMPEKDGYEVCEFVKRHPTLAATPVLLLTGAFEPFDQERASRAGADGFLAKPFEPQALIAKVKDLLGRQAAAAGAARPAAPPAPGPAPAPAEDEAEVYFEPEEAEPTLPVEGLAAPMVPRPAPAPAQEILPDADLYSFAEEAPLGETASPAEPAAPYEIEAGAATEWAGVSTMDTVELSLEERARAGVQAAQAAEAETSAFEEVFEQEAFRAPSTAETVFSAPAPSFLPEDIDVPGLEGPPVERAAVPAAPPEAPSPRLEPAYTWTEDATPVRHAAPPRLEPSPAASLPGLGEPFGSRAAMEEEAALGAAVEQPAAAPVAGEAETPGPAEGPAGAAVPADMVQQIARRVVAQLSEQVVREIAWEVVPELAEALIKKEIERLRAQLQET
jgi:CheY-like chemotaxis protein